MKRRDPGVSFSAYAGTDEGPATAPRRERQRRQEPQRREAVAEKPRSPLRLWVLAMLLLASLAGLVAQYSVEINRYVNRPIASVRMETPLHRVDEMEVRSVLARHLHEGFFGFDAKRLKQELEQHPWIEQAVIRRVWPDSLAVSIHEEVPIARWGDERLLNQSAEVFRPKAVDTGISLPMLRGPEGSQQQMMEQYQVFNQLLLTSGLRIQELSLNERGSWSVIVNDGLVINIGRQDVMERLQRFVTFYDRHMDSEAGTLSAFDLRYRNGISVRKKEAGTNGVAFR